MLIIHVSEIPPEGIDVRQSLRAGEIHIEDEDSFILESGSLDCRVERGEDAAVHVQGRLEGRLRLECNRCLDPFVLSVEQKLDLFYLPHAPQVQGEEEEDVELGDRDVVVAYYSEDRLDLGETVREQFLLALPMKRLCREQCEGLCPSCGKNRNRDSCACEPEVDARFSPLEALLKKGAS